MRTRSNIVIAGGGTGGHIYPGLAIAHSLQSLRPDLEVHFVGTQNGLEKKLVPAHGFPLHFISIGKLNESRGILSKMKTLFSLPVALIQSAALLLELKPQYVLGVGGYASGPFVLMAALMGFRTALWEPNAKPGLTNRWLSRFVKKSFVVFEEAHLELKNQIIQIGLPLRREIETLAETAHLDFIESKPPFKILIFGGSQGARAINQAVMKAVQSGMEWRQDIEIFHQTGKLDFEQIQSSYEGLKGVQAAPYIDQMAERYTWADLVICRAGASTVAEIAAARKVALFIPLPSAADDHQRKNAESLVDKEAAFMLPQSQLTPQSLIDFILKIKQDPNLRLSVQKKLGIFHKPRAADNMARLLIEDIAQAK